MTFSLLRALNHAGHSISNSGHASGTSPGTCSGHLYERSARDLGQVLNTYLLKSPAFSAIVNAENSV
jgi:hypothetical protein